MNSPLQLEHYFFQRMHCVAEPSITIEDIEAWHAADLSRFELRVEAGNNPDLERQWQVQVDLRSNPDFPEPAPYDLHFTAIGLFCVDESFDHDDLERLIRVNGASVLYSAMRELVALFTSRAPWGAVKLPTVNFRLLTPAESQRTERTDEDDQHY